MRSIPIDVIRAFVAVVEARGFTRAAEELGRSQPTVSLQVKRLEELVEAPLFEKAARFELTAVGSVCFDYGRRLIRLHDDMLSEAERRRAPDLRLRLGMPGAFAERVAPLVDGLRRGAGVDVVTAESAALLSALDQNALDLALAIGREAPEGAVGRWRAPLGWYARAGDARAQRSSKPVALVLPPEGSAVREAAVEALRAVERPFVVACASADFAVVKAAVSAGVGIAPMVAALAPDGLARARDPSLPDLPDLVVSLSARDSALAAAGLAWVAAALESLAPL